MNGVDEKNNEFLKNVPSFSIQSLIDQIPGQKFDTDEFISDTIESKYYTPAEFISTKFSKKSFTMFHMNIASLQAHIDELKSLLTFLDHPFDVIGITETRLNDESPWLKSNYLAMYSTILLLRLSVAVQEFMSEQNIIPND
jgi:hypothetical protein